MFLKKNLCLLSAEFTGNFANLSDCQVLQVLFTTIYSPSTVLPELQFSFFVFHH
jgi:hypothetical protein